MKRRLLVMLGLLTLFFVVSREIRKRFSETAAVWSPGQEAAGGASIDQMVRSEPLQPSSPPVTAETAPPAEEEAVTPPHGDPLEREVTEGADDGAEAAPAEAATEERAAGPAGATGSSQPDGSEPAAEAG
jgi:hypothetical protein